VETLDVRTSPEPPDAVRLCVECGVRETREHTVTETEEVRFRLSHSCFAAAVAAGLWSGGLDAQARNGADAGAVLAVMFGIPVLALGVDMVSLAVSTPVTLTAGAFAGKDHEQSERFDFRYHCPATSVKLTDLGTGSALTLTDQPRSGWLLQPQEMADLGFRSRTLLLETEGHAQHLVCHSASSRPPVRTRVRESGEPLVRRTR
jgi:hypothetical protein